MSTSMVPFTGQLNAQTILCLSGPKASSKVDCPLSISKSSIFTILSEYTL